ncbi:growth hormone secretagogue receptor type 1-like isoform X1 [Styela clava]
MSDIHSTVSIQDPNSTTTVPANAVGQSPVTHEQQVAMTVAIAFLGLWCAIGNIVTILAITTRRYMRTKTNVFILSLAISDLLSGLIASPLWLYRRTWGFNPWELGQFACKLYWVIDETTSYCTAMHIASFAIWRFILVRWPHRMGTTKIRTITIWVCTIWVISIIFGGFVYSLFYESVEKPQDGGVYSHWPMCSIKFVDDGIAKFKMYYTFSSTMFMLFPMAILFVMSMLIVKELFFNKTFKSELRKIKEKKAVAQLAMIAASFMIGYIPMTSYMMWTIRVSNKDKSLDYWMGVAAYFCLRFSECMNPVAYNVSSNKMRKASKEVLALVWTCCGKRAPVSQTPSRVSHSTPNEAGLYVGSTIITNGTKSYGNGPK